MFSDLSSSSPYGEDELKSENIIVKSLNDENSEQIIMNISEIENFIQNIK